MSGAEALAACHTWRTRHGTIEPAAYRERVDHSDYRKTKPSTPLSSIAPTRLRGKQPPLIFKKILRELIYVRNPRHS